MSTKQLVRPTRGQVLSLYKRLLKESKRMVMPSRKEWLIYRVRADTREQMNETNEGLIIDHFRLGEVHLDSIRGQVDHYNKFFEQPKVQKQPTLEQKIEERSRQRDPFDSDDEVVTTTPHPLQRPQVVLEQYSNTIDVPTPPAIEKE